MNGLDLFSGIGGISLALRGWVETIAYCEQDRYAQAVLLSKMSEDKLDRAPIWDDVRTLQGSMLPRIDIITGGFPCQDISVAGRGEGLAGERSGLFFEVVRLAEETKAPFVFLENVPAIRTRGLRAVARAFTDLRYDCRWACVSASEVGAPHLRKRWFMLAHSKCHSLRHQLRRRDGENWQSEGVTRDDGEKKPLANSKSIGWREGQSKSEGRPRGSDFAFSSGALANSHSKRLQSAADQSKETWTDSRAEFGPCVASASWWEVEPNVGRVADGLPSRVDRLKCLGNAVVPMQARKAFEKLLGIEASV